MIREFLLSATIMCTSLSAMMAADRTNVIDYFTCDFTDGIPEGVILEDADGAQLHFLMIQAGFDQGDSWKVLYERSTGNYYAASPSMHTTQEVCANDKMTFPPILIRGGSALMSWRCRAYNDQSTTPSTYSILVGDEVILDHAEAPTSGWVSMDISLDKYVGQRINVTFVNNTLNGEVLAIDDITISGEPGVATVAVQPGEYALGGESFRIGATFTASSDYPITSVGLKCEVDGQELYAEESGLNIQRGESTTLLIDKEFNLEFGSTMDYVVTPVVNDVTYDPITCSTTPLAFMPKKRVVVEEGTGMWCGWCPLGIVATDSLKMAFGSDVIPIAIHFGSDLVAFDAYASALGITGAPYGIFDRKVETADPMTLVKDGRKESYTIWRGGFGTLAQQRLAIHPMAEITADTNISADKNSAEISCQIRFAADVTNGDYKIALVMVEDDVWSLRYYQTNYLANYPERAPMGGFESMPEYITSDFKFQHVARAVADNAFTGIKNSVPSTLTAGETASFNYTMSIPSDVLNVSKLQIVAMLIDGADGSIINAYQVPLDKTDIEQIESTDNIRIQISNGSLIVTGRPGEEISASLIDMSGRTIVSESDSGTVTLSAPRGIYVVRTPSMSKLVTL